MKRNVFNRQSLFIGLISIGLLCGTPTIATAQSETPDTTGRFRQIEQPLGLKMGITAAGLGLISLELWWFLIRKNKV